MHTSAQYVLQRVAFPLALLGVFTVSATALAAGMAPAAVVTLAYVAAFAAVLPLERWLPRAAQPSEEGEPSADATWFLVTALVSSPAADALAVALAASIAEVTASGGLASLPLPVGFLLATLIGSFGDYWAHRWSHTRWWRLHAVHHAPHRMVALNNLRLHPVDVLLKRVPTLLPLLVLGVSAEAIALFGVLQAVVNVFQHADADLRHGALNLVFSTNSVHRWHHSARPEEANANYGSPINLWDHAFGTFFLPEEVAEPTRMGLFVEGRYPIHDVVRAMVAPACWERCVSSSYGHPTNRPT